MSKSSKPGKRQLKRERNRTPGLTVMLGIGGAIAFVAWLIVTSGFGIPMLEQEQDRLELDPILGNPDAAITIVEYGAYACSACRAWHQAGIIDQILEAYPGQVRFIFRDFPVISPAYDQMAAQIAQCALDQSQTTFWGFHDALYTRADFTSSRDDLFTLGVDVGLDREALRSCYEAGTHRQTVQYDEQRARSLGLPGTPSFLVNGARIFNATPSVLQAEIEKLLN